MCCHIFSFAKLSVNFHQFQVNYWMSFAMQHGLELSGRSFALELKSDLALVPVTDGLVHRSNTVWSVDYLSCELLDTKIWLCRSQHKHEKEVSLYPFVLMDSSIYMDTIRMGWSINYFKGQQVRIFKYVPVDFFYLSK